MHTRPVAPLGAHNDHEPPIDSPRYPVEYPPCSLCEGCRQAGTTPRGFGEFGLGCSLWTPKDRWGE